LWLINASSVPLIDSINLNEAAIALQKGIPLALFMSLALSVNYARTRKIFAPVSFIFITLSAALFTYAGCMGLTFAKNMEVSPFLLNRATIGAPGLILTNPTFKTVLLGSPEDPLSKRVVMTGTGQLQYLSDETQPGKKDILQDDNLFWGKKNILFNYFDDGAAVNETFENILKTITKDIMIDLETSAAILEKYFLAGKETFFPYISAFIFLCIAVSYILPFRIWPLARLFIGLIALRFLLSAQVLLPKISLIDDIYLMLGQYVQAVYIAPILFTLAGGLLILFLLIRFYIGGGNSRAQNGE
jgi:hypothetical protein